MQITRDDYSNIGLLETKLAREGFRRLFYGQFMGNPEFSKARNEVMPSFQPITTYKNFAAEGSDHMRLPMIMELKGNYVSGDVDAERTGEAMRLRWNNCYINKRTKVVASPAEMANQRAKGLQLLKQQQPLLRRWHPRQMDVEISSAIYERYNRNITGTGAGQLSISKRQHPNIWVADYGKVVWSGTDATYRASINTAISGWGGSVNEGLTVSLLKDMYSALRNANIMPVEYKGIEFFILLAHENAHAQLKADPAYRDDTRLAAERGMLNARFTGLATMCEGFLIFPRFGETVFGFDIDGSNVITWGAANGTILETADTYDKKGNIILGSNALSYGWAGGPTFERKPYNFDSEEEWAMKLIDGVVRTEHYDVVPAEGTPTAVTCKNSALLLTNSPATFG